jgi:hypothetical protein
MDSFVCIIGRSRLRRFSASMTQPGYSAHIIIPLHLIVGRHGIVAFSGAKAPALLIDDRERSPLKVNC